MTIVLVADPDVSSVVYALLEADGTEHLLDGSEGVYADSVTVIGAPDVVIVSARAPGRPGEVVRNVAIGKRQVEIPFLVNAATNSSLRNRIDLLSRWVDPLRGEVVLRCYREDGGIRDLHCRLVDGLEINYAAGGFGTMRVPATLEATADPYVYDTDETTASYGIGATFGFFDSPFFPLKLSASAVIATTALDNDGTADIYPVWTITGPGSDPSIRNLDTGLAATLDYTLALGEQVIIDTRIPERRPTDSLGRPMPQVRSTSGDNLYPLLSEDYLWTFPVGSTRFQIAMTGATADSSIELSFARRWQTF